MYPPLYVQVKPGGFQDHEYETVPRCPAMLRSVEHWSSMRVQPTRT